MCTFDAKLTLVHKKVFIMFDLIREFVKGI